MWMKQGEKTEKMGKKDYDGNREICKIEEKKPCSRWG